MIELIETLSKPAVVAMLNTLGVPFMMLVAIGAVLAKLIPIHLALVNDLRRHSAVVSEAIKDLALGQTRAEQLLRDRIGCGYIQKSHSASGNHRVVSGQIEG